MCKYNLKINNMKRIATSSIEAGMVLERPVTGPNGNILLSKGTVLQSGMANRLKSWGIPFVYIEGESGETEDGVPVKKIDSVELEKSLDEVFGDLKNDPTMQLIYSEVFEHLLKKGS